MNKEQLKKIKDRVEAAMDGPWKYDGEAIYDSKTTRIADVWVDAGPCQYVLRGTKETHEFIAHARTDIPNLLDEVKRLQDVLREAWIISGKRWKSGCGFDGPLDQMLTEAIGETREQSK